MSAFLGPIHHWLYQKIQCQEALTKTLLAAFPEQEAALSQKLDETFGTLPEGDLADIIDGGNIHGWLQEKVSMVENRLALAAGTLATDEGTKDTLLQAATRAGEQFPIQGESLQEIYQALENVLLDGMPCDRVNTLLGETEDTVKWERSNDLHSHFWTENNANPLLFDEIRGAWVNGMLKGTGVAYEKDGALLTLRQVEA